MIKSYIDSIEYKKCISTEKNLITELKCVEKNNLLNFILAEKLASYFIEKYGQEMKYGTLSVGCIPKDHKYNPSILVGIFISVLQKYTYENIINAKNVKVSILEFNDFEEATNLLEYITYLYNQYTERNYY